MALKANSQTQRLKEIMTKDANPNLALRITVESGGCHGFQYLMSLTNLPPLSNSPAPDMLQETPPALNTSSPDPNAMPSGSPTSSEPSSGTAEEAKVDEDDTVFKALDGSEAKVVMDGPSLELLKGSKIDFTMELIGSQFKIVDNPLATSSCGCGTSFDIKV
jgi:iron-sulfur cluster assembly 2